MYTPYNVSAGETENKGSAEHLSILWSPGSQRVYAIGPSLSIVQVKDEIDNIEDIDDITMVHFKTSEGLRVDLAKCIEEPSHVPYVCGKYDHFHIHDNHHQYFSH